MAVFFFWMMVIWMFVVLFADVLRRDMSGWAKAGWIILMVVVPFIGMLAYLVARPRTEERDFESYRARAPIRQGPSQPRPSDEIAKAAELREQGRITDAEFDLIKQHALTY
jgi:hypothetical protein